MSSFVNFITKSFLQVETGFLKPLLGLEEFTIVHFASTKLWNRDYLNEDEKAADDIIVGKRTTKNTVSSPCLSLFQFPPKKRSLFFFFFLLICNNKLKYLMELIN